MKSIVRRELKVACISTFHQKDHLQRHIAAVSTENMLRGQHFKKVLW